MRLTQRLAGIWLGALGAAAFTLGADESASRVRDLERRGQARDALELLQSAAKANPRDAASLEQLALFLDERNEPGARAAYEKVLAAAGPSSPRGQAALRRLAVLDLLAGDQAAARKRLAQLRDTGVTGFELAPASTLVATIPHGTVAIPGPMRSFARMAALSPDLPESEALLALARNIVTNGYQAIAGGDGLDQTEYLKLVVRYLGQAREIERLTGADKQLKIETCDSTQTGELLKVLGFRMRGGCGAEVVLETVNATRAFLSMDSGFPLAELEEALRTNRPFVYDYRPTVVPVLYSSEYWLPAKEKQSGEFIDAFLNDPSMCRLYLGLAKLDPETAEQVRKSLPVARIRAFAHVFDFFGGMFRIRDGKVATPGGDRAAQAWADLAGVSPNDGVKFIERLVTRDDGWLAAYFDALLRIHGPTLEYLSEPTRLKRHYAALRGKVTSPGPARPVFRANTDLMLLTTRLRADAGRPLIPGGLDVWKKLFVEHPNGKYDGKLTKSAAGWKEGDDLIEALFGLSRKAVDNEPLKMFLAVSDLERRRSRPLEPATVTRLIYKYRTYSAQYAVLNEAAELSEKTINSFLDTADAVAAIKDGAMKSDTAGTLQALMGLWQVVVRQRLAGESEADALLATLLEPFVKVRNSRDLFDAGRSGVLALLKATGAAETDNPQEKLLDVLAGAATTTDEETRQALIAEMLRGVEAQKLVSVKSLFDLAAALESLAKGDKPNMAQVNRLAARISDMNLPKASLSAQERNAFAFGYWTDRHIDAQRKLNLRAAIEKAAGNPEKLGDLRGALATLLRDSLVGLLYVHYAPPGAQILYTNPLFARSHDFIGIQGVQQTWKSTEVLGTGWPSSAGGRLVGSLASLPYALAEAEQNFLIPTREQALIWGDLVPQLLVSAKLPRFWRVTPAQTHAVALRMRLGETVVAESALDSSLRERSLAVLDRLAPPARVRKVGDLLAAGRVAEAMEQITPAEAYHLGVEADSLKPASGAALLAEIAALQAAAPSELSPAALSQAFGTPKPTLANSQRPELLNLRTFPTLMGYSSRILAESWESNNLFFASLADELYLRPSQLNVLLPEWTQRTVEQIFATHLEDWPALLRSMRTVAGGIRAQARKSQALETKAGLED